MMGIKNKMTAKNAMLELKNVKHQISEDTAAIIVKRYKAFRNKISKAQKTDGKLPASMPALPLALTYNKPAIEGLLNGSNCVAIRMYRPSTAMGN